MDEFQPQNQPVNFLEPKNHQLHSADQPKRRWWLYFLLIIVILGGVNCGIKKLTLAGLPENASAYDPITLKPKNVGFLQTVKNFIFSPESVLAGQSDNRINILLLGMGGPGHDGPFLTDTNIIVSIRPKQNEVAMISVPRDLGANIPGYGIGKINAANSIGETKQKGTGGEFTRQIFEKVFNLNIPYYIRVDFTAFTEIIDAVGGVIIDVPNAFTDTMFPGPNDSYQTISFNTGKTLMNGQRALEYARSRHGSNGEASDFARARRQQQVLTALKEKLLTAGSYTNPITIQKMLSSLANHVTTNLNFGQIMYLASIAKEVNSPNKTLVIDNSTSGFLTSSINENGAFILSPKTGNFDNINNAITNIFNDEITLSTKNLTPAKENMPVFPTAKIEIQNGTWHVGLAALYQDKLENKGFTVAYIGNCTMRPVTDTIIYTVNPNVSTSIITELAKELNAKTEKTLPAWITEKINATTTKYKLDSDVLIVLGENSYNK